VKREESTLRSGPALNPEVDEGKKGVVAVRGPEGQQTEGEKSFLRKKGDLLGSVRTGLPIGCGESHLA